RVVTRWCKGRPTERFLPYARRCVKVELRCLEAKHVEDVRRARGCRFCSRLHRSLRQERPAAARHTDHDVERAAGPARIRPADAPGPTWTAWTAGLPAAGSAWTARTARTAWSTWAALRAGAIRAHVLERRELRHASLQHPVRQVRLPVPIRCRLHPRHDVPP